MRHCYRTFFLLLAITCGVALRAQTALEITSIRPFASGDSLMCGFTVPGLFDGAIGETLLSGLPVLIELSVSLDGGNGATQALPLRKYRLSYDIWEDQFLLESARRQRRFASLDALKQWWNPRDSLALLPLKRLDGDKTWKVQLHLKVILLSRTQGDKLKEWLLGANETEENLPSQERDTGFKLNLNSLVSLFFNKSEVRASYEGRQKSPAFRVGDLTGKQK